MSGERMDRRSFLKGISLGSFGLALLGFTAGIWRSLTPKAFREPSSKVKVGVLDEYPLGTFRKVGDRNLFVFRREQGIAAMSAACTHLGCIVEQREDKFVCPCHGSLFNDRGDVIGGPAPAPLPWYEVSFAPDGKLVVDVSRIVNQEQYLAV